VTNAGGANEDVEAANNGRAGEVDEGGCGNGGGTWGGGVAATDATEETLAKVSAVPVSTSELAAGSTSRRKWRKKSTPMIGKETVASKKFH